MSTHEQSRQPAGVPVGGQFATSPKAEAVGVHLTGIHRTTLGFAGVATLDDIGQQPLPAWPQAQAPVSNIDYGWGDDGQLEVRVTFGDDTMTLWGNHETWSDSADELPDEWDHVPVEDQEQIRDYTRTVHENLLHLTHSFAYAAHAAPGVRATLLGLATGQGAPAPVYDPDDPAWVAPTDGGAARAEQNLKAWLGTTTIDESTIQDALTDILHLARARGMSPTEFGEVFHRAQGIYRNELESPEG